MKNDVSTPSAFLRGVYVLLIAVATAAAAGRVLSTERVYEPHLAPPTGVNDGRYQPWPPTQPRAMPTFGSNDRSRWDTVRALVDDGTFVIGRFDPDRVSPDNLEGVVGIAAEDGWKTVDKVRHPEWKVFLSSKPPLLSVLMAGQYWLLKHLFGWEIATKTNEVVRAGLLTFNVLPFAFYLWLLSLLAERFGTTDWGRLFVVAAGAFGTLLTPFLTTFNNHTPAAVACLAAWYVALRAAERPPAGALATGSRLNGGGWFLLAGVACGFLVNVELPAAAFAAAVGLLLLIRAPSRTLLWFLPPLALFAGLFFYLNDLATGQLLPVYEQLDTPWYQYEGSVLGSVHLGGGRGIEYAKFQESRWTYLFHLLLGHHGWFSLTPVNVLGAAGMVFAVVLLARGKTAGCPGFGWRATAAGGLVVSLVVIVFYGVVVETANYGGWTSAPRWLLWLTPLWLVAMLPVADWLGRRRWGRVLCIVLLALSVLSATYPAWNPWRHPWLYNWMEYNGVVDY
jgi:hypothetical protein